MAREQTFADRFRDFIGPHAKYFQNMGTEPCADRDICRIAPACHENLADAALIVARIERVPGPPYVGFQPAREIHRRIRYRYADVGEIAGAVTRRNVETAQQCDGDMREIPTDALAFAIGLPRRLGRTSEMIAKRDMLIGKIANRLHARPPPFHVPEQAPGIVHQMLSFTVAAAKQI